MAEEDEQSGDRTEAATARRLERAREAGQVPISREIATFGSLAGATVVLTNYTPMALGAWLDRLVSLIQHIGTAEVTSTGLWRLVGLGLAGPVLPPVVAAAVGGALAVVIQTRGLLHLAGLSPNLSRISPVAGIKRLFGVGGLVELLKSLGKLAALGSATYLVARSDLRNLTRLPFQAVQSLPVEVGRVAMHVLYAAVGVQAVIGAADLLWVLFHHAQTLRMSKQDIRDEFKETEGNPQMKSRIRRIGFARARRRMMSRVRTATVVVTNPTHYAVALAYDQATNSAPRIVAKGVDHVAAKIREIAVASGVPIISNPPLARALHQLDLETEIPADHFRAVAQIIAHIWRLQRERPPLT